MQKENILNLIPQPPPTEKERISYTSQFKSTVKDEYKKSKFPYKTMGEPEYRGADPKDFLKKKEEKPNAEKVPCDFHNEKRKPPVPKHNETPPPMGIKTTKNFIAQNSVDNIMSVSKKPQKFIVDTRNGDKFQLETSGLDTVYTAKKDYGKTPEYLEQRKEELQKMQQEYDAYVKEMQRRGKMHRLSEEEIQEILYGLKTNWENIYRQYQSLSVTVDTIPKKNRKEWMEHEMKELEKDIEMLERYQTIYVAN